MTNEEIQKLMEFILQQQAESSKRQAEHNTKVDNQIEFLLEQQAKHEAEIHELRIASEKSSNKLNEAMASLAKTVEIVESEAKQDRQEMREAVEALITNSEDIRNITKQLTTVVIGMNKRVKKLEDKSK
ncbi:MAG: hypothetical protein HY819_17330 [Acidobacteria bacterium]|nr:hypothetical protein [Acidobacteriota bacterium]